jgi:Fic family protein
LALPLARASHALGELSGIGRSLLNPELLIRPFSRAEAVASSKIEGTVTSTPELLMLELGPAGSRASPDTREVNNYNAALRHGLKRIADLPLSKRLFNELHEVMLPLIAALDLYLENCARTKIGSVQINSKRQVRSFASSTITGFARQS